MTPRERAEAIVAKWSLAPIAWEGEDDRLEAAIGEGITEHVRALLADDEAMIEAMVEAYYAAMKETQEVEGCMRAALAALRRKAGV